MAWFRQAITLANFDQDLCPHKALLCHNELKMQVLCEPLLNFPAFVKFTHFSYLLEYGFPVTNHVYILADLSAT